MLERALRRKDSASNYTPDTSPSQKAYNAREGIETGAVIISYIAMFALGQKAYNAREGIETKTVPMESPRVNSCQKAYNAREGIETSSFLDRSNCSMNLVRKHTMLERALRL